MPSGSFGQCDDCQNIIQNPTMLKTVAPNVPSTNSFCFDDVAFWGSALNTPHHITVDANGNCSGSNPGTMFNCITAAVSSSDNVTTEGIYYRRVDTDDYDSDGNTTEFVPLFVTSAFIPSYCVSITTQGLDCPNFGLETYLDPFDFNLVASSGITECTPLTAPMPFNFPSGTSSQPIGILATSGLNTVTSDFIYVPNADYDHLLLFPDHPAVKGRSTTSIQNVSVSCSHTAVQGFTHEIVDCEEKRVAFSPNIAGNHPIASWDWNFSEGSSQEEAPTFQFSDFGTYQVCLSTTDIYGCCSEEFCEDVVIEPCPSCGIQGDLYLDGENPAADQFSELIAMGAFPQNGTISGLDIVVNGSFILDENFTYNNCQFYFEPGAELIVRSPGNITIVRSTLQGCSRMWKGITVEGTGVNNRFNFQRNTITDAYHALTMLDGCHIVQGTNVFDANYIGIFSPAASTVKTHFGSPVTGSQFVSYKPMLPAYQGQPFWAASTFAGIQVFDLTSLIVTESSFFPFLGISATNLFDRVQNGIIFQNTNLGIIGNEFRNIQDFGIEGERCNIVRANENSFTDVPQAVSLQSSMGADVVLQGNNYTDPTSPTVGVGQMIIVTGLTDSSVKIIGNTCSVDNLNSVGISLNSCSNMTEVNVLDNSIMCSSFSNGSISLTNVSKLEGSPANVTNNTVMINCLLASHGLRLTNTNSFAVLDNHVSVNTNASQSSMLTFINSSDCLVSDNTVTNNQGTNVYGYITNSSLGNIYCCNTSTNTKRGFDFRGPCNNTDLKSSVLDNNDIGLYLWNAELGPQVLGGNLWQGASISKATYVAGLGNPQGFQASPFTVNPNQSGTLPAQVQPLNGWFGQSGGTGPLCPQSNPDPECGESWNGILPPSVPPSQLCADIEQYISSIAPQRGTWVFQDQYDWMLYYYAFIKKYQNTTSADWSSCYPLTGTNVNVKTVAEYYDIEIQMQMAYEPTSSEQIALNTSQALLTTAIDDLMAVYQLIDSEQAYMANVSTIVQLQSDIDMYYATIGNIKSTIQVRGNAVLANLIATVQGLATDFPFLVKYKAILEYQVLAMLHGLDYLTTTDWATVRTIADGCELEDGQAVFEARALLSLIGEVYEDSYDACTGSTAPRSLTTTQPNIVVYPNPSYANVTVSLATPLLGGSSLVLVNQLGRKVHTTRVEEKASEVKLEVEGLATGVYILYVSDPSGTMLHSEKVIVLR